MGDSEELLAEIAELISEELNKHEEVIQRILTKLAVDEKEYKALMVKEVVQDLWVEAHFAVSSTFWRKALDTFHKKLERDKRLFLT